MVTRRPLIIEEGVVKEISFDDVLEIDTVEHPAFPALDVNGMSFTDTATASINSNLKNNNTTPKTYTFPNKSGTVAMLSDLPTPVIAGSYIITIGLTDDQSNHTGTVLVYGMQPYSIVVATLGETDENGDDEVCTCSLSVTPIAGGFTYNLSSNGPIFGQFLIHCFAITPEQN